MDAVAGFGGLGQITLSGFYFGRERPGKAGGVLGPGAHVYAVFSVLTPGLGGFKASGVGQ
jgi:hypothetical protein